MKKGKKIAILGAGNVGATVAYTLVVQGVGSEFVLIDINEEKAKGEAMDIIQGTAFSLPVDLYAGSYADAAGADIVIVTVGMGRKPGQTRLELAKSNVDVIKSVIPPVVKYAPDAVYVVVSNPVDILTYVITQISGLPSRQIIGSGTLLDTARLRNAVADHVGLNSKNVHAYVYGEHGDTSMIPWSLTNIAGLDMKRYCESLHPAISCGPDVLAHIEDDVRTAGAQVIAAKGATYFAVSLTVRRICETILNDTDSILTVSSLLEGEYGIDDICMSIPYTVGAAGIISSITPPLTPEEEALLHKSAEALKSVRDQLGLPSILHA